MQTVSSSEEYSLPLILDTRGMVTECSSREMMKDEVSSDDSTVATLPLSFDESFESVASSGSTQTLEETINDFPWDEGAKTDVNTVEEETPSSAAVEDVAVHENLDKEEVQEEAPIEKAPTQANDAAQTNDEGVEYDVNITSPTNEIISEPIIQPPATIPVCSQTSRENESASPVVPDEQKCFKEEVATKEKFSTSVRITYTTISASNYHEKDWEKLTRSSASTNRKAPHDQLDILSFEGSKSSTEEDISDSLSTQAAASFNKTASVAAQESSNEQRVSMKATATKLQVEAVLATLVDVNIDLNNVSVKAVPKTYML